ncbi:MAG: FHA domain-containing protein [Deltaproteobacteria bacterium]|nr:FHA domain-containing protein [Deltaproteobacteria bacterium]
MSLISGSVCQKCFTLNEWTAANCRACMAPIDPATGSARVVKVFHANRGGKGDVAEICGAGQARVGRTYGDITFPGDKLLSPVHAVFVSEPAGPKVVDAGGLNGVFIRVAEAPIRVGDSFMCASEVLKLAGVLKAEEAAPLSDGTHVSGSPVPPPGSLIFQQVLLGGKAGRMWVRKPPVTIGREGCDISFPGTAFVSTRHAVIDIADGRLAVKDLNSANGTFVRVRGKAPLVDGDVVLMGQQLFRISVKG